MLSTSRNDAESIIVNDEIRLDLTEAENGQWTLYDAAKRMLDIIGATFGIILLLPVLIVVSIIIKMDDPKGSVFYYQTRVGKHERPFRMFKFRSMVRDADKQLEKLLKQNEIEGAMFKMKRDPRVTRIGRFIRKTSIDELPQLVNVLQGNMSLVGPRPPLPREVAEYTPHDKQRLMVKPGCTGLWQISGRNELSFDQMVDLDLTYIKKKSIWFDLTIILRTFRVLLGSKDAY
ncbi:exopolysaccharide biosynthesis polyprenyl glycosylphosphotransferase [Paenibacillus cellulosilyticus]|uniref:Exopolysaccharide biosynthesis polyprenyl glycosylphosphotransferase n=1 Tax=Paenibacillus cellulosilyticus TaxID=375489 RepID=A0A2V2Z109_9BACL|nr:sugar transferase [Paenibacillus cellulosilyticus]PWW08482.1 exopolysaccharide biosynthesis polyprenyl glycosylphosphotransferase [Paenibacillus cellulosilyticus]QKS48066.1 sugar transferase [Paenibacillus cellulosilyticus]